MSGALLVADSRAWFRLYSEFAFDPKVQLMDETLQRRFLMLLCLAGAGITPTDDVSSVDFALRVGVSECERTRSILVSRGLIDEQWFPKAWKKRQFESDTSTPRVKRYRERLRIVSKIVTETPSEQSRAEQKKSAVKPLVFHESLPRERWDDWLAHRREKHWSMSPRALNTQLKLLAKFDTATQREIIDTSLNAGWQGLFAPKGKAMNGSKPHKDPYAHSE